MYTLQASPTTLKECYGYDTRTDNNLYRVRVLLKVSRPVLAQRLGVPKATIKNYETGLRRVPASYLIAIIGLCTSEQRDCILVR